MVRFLSILIWCRLVIIIFSICELYCLAYSIVFVVIQNGCETELKVGDGVRLTLWILTKSISCLFWVYAVIFIFWPSGLKKSEGIEVDSADSSETEET